MEITEDLPECSTDTSPTDLIIKLLFEKLSLAGMKPAILSLIPPYTDKYMSMSSRDILPKSLKSLQQLSHFHLQYNELLNVCETVSVQVTDEVTKTLEKEKGSVNI